GVQTCALPICYEFAMTRAKNSFTFDIEGFRDVTASVLEWPLSVIRLKSDEKSNLIEAADHILTTWKNYSDTSANIKAFTDETPHNTDKPIARRRGKAFELALVLLNNLTNAEHPLG